jgi:hypothetical protein
MRYSLRYFFSSLLDKIVDHMVKIVFHIIFHVDILHRPRTAKSAASSAPWLQWNSRDLIHKFPARLTHTPTTRLVPYSIPGKRTLSNFGCEVLRGLVNKASLNAIFSDFTGNKTVLLEIRVFQGFFTNTSIKSLKKQRFFTKREKPVKVFWKTFKGFWWKTLPKGSPENL